ncbi:MAG TPA: ABC transporter ATP-binding protein [Gemmatimonadales bacterium]
MSAPLLSLRHLTVDYATDRGTARAVDSVSLDVASGETVALVGESGSGKTTLALSLLGLLPEPPARVAPESRIEYQGANLAGGDNASWRRVRGREMGMVFQDPSLSLNPVLTVGSQVAEVVRTHSKCTRREATTRAAELLAMVGVDSPALRARQYAHQLSGGLRQRAMIAIALAGEPKLLIADEPTAALDVTVQAQIVELLAELRRRLGMAVLLVTHDFGLVAQMADRVVVMYAGQVAEMAPAPVVFSGAAHPYTQGLLLAARGGAGSAERRLAAIPGAPPAATAWPSACRFHPRCARAWNHCRAEAPQLERVSEGHDARCWLVSEPAGETGGRPS